MSDFAHGLLVLGATRTALQKCLKARGRAAFLAAGPGKVLRLWPDTDAPAALADSLSAELAGSRVLRFATHEAGLEVAVHVAGAAAAEAQVALRLRTAKQLAQAHAALQRVAAALDYAGRLPALLRDGPSRPTFLALAGVHDADVARLHFALLQGLRRGHPEEAARLEAVRFLGADGKAQPFAQGPGPAGEPGAAAGGGLQAAGTFREWMEASERIAPARELEALLAALTPGPRFPVSEAQATQLRERAAALLRDVAEREEALRPGLLARAHTELERAGTPALRAAWAEVLGAEPAEGAVRASLARALAQEEELGAVRALYRAYAHLPAQVEEAALLQAAGAPEALERKGAYALLEHTESTAAVVALRERLAHEQDAGARGVLVRVVEALTSL